MIKNFYFTLFILLCFIFTKAQKQTAQEPAQKLNEKGVKLLIDSLSNALNRWYIYPDKATLMANTVKTNYKNGAYKSAKTNHELSLMIYLDVIKVHKDGHLRIRYNPEIAKDLETVCTDEQGKEDAKENLKVARENNFSFVKAEMLPGKIGYLRWDAFENAGFLDESKSVFNGAFQVVKNSRALIIDMRYNGGGDPEMVQFTQSYFFNQKLRMNDIIDRKNDTVIKAWIDPAKTGLTISTSVYILTGRGTFSGAEDFTYGLQQAKRAIVVGDTTGGGAHPTDMVSLGQGFILHVPCLRSCNAVSKTNWEGKGVWPDVMVKSEKALAKTQLIILSDLISKTQDEEEKHNLQWALNGLKRQLINKDSVKITKETLLKYSGEYITADQEKVRMTILLDGDHLYRRNHTTEDIRLVPFSSNRFFYDDDTGRNIEFKVGADGQVLTFTVSTSTGQYIYNRTK
ncbi:MAG: hypothetical protein K0S32_3601 [Bacteroidetes bacterium]|jgi:hypothetical protein|nr:hypothetical protein [Bacteroidota bacterium]